jgi:beta-lactamase class A
VDTRLQNELMYHLEQLGLNKAVKQGRLAVALVDVTDLEQPRLAHVNGNKMMYAASLPKIAILFAAFHQITAGKLKKTQSLIRDMTDMIRVSSNQAATRVMNMVGPYKLNQLLQTSPYRFYDVNNNGGLWVGKPYGKSPAFQRDPLHAISHGATAWQVARFYYLIENESLISPQASREMKEMLSKPRIHHKFVAGLEKVHPDSAIFRKSGTWRTYHADSAIVERDGRRYIAVALANDQNGGEWLKEIIVAMDNIIFTTDAPLQVSMAD